MVIGDCGYSQLLIMVVMNEEEGGRLGGREVKMGGRAKQCLCTRG